MLALKKDIATVGTGLTQALEVIRDSMRYATKLAINKVLTVVVELEQKIYRWLAAPDPSSNHNTACKRHQPTTGGWFIDSDLFKDWKSASGSFIWLHGIRKIIKRFS